MGKNQDIAVGENQDIAVGENQDIAVGKARVPFAPAVLKYNLPEGWVLPGGERTTDEARAKRVATNMSKLMA